MDDLRSTLADFDPDAPLPGMPDPWAFMPTPTKRPGPPWAMAEMIAAEPGLADRVAARLLADGSAEALASLVRGAAAAGAPVVDDRLRHVRARGDGHGGDPPRGVALVGVRGTRARLRPGVRAGAGSTGGRRRDRDQPRGRDDGDDGGHGRRSRTRRRDGVDHAGAPRHRRPPGRTSRSRPSRWTAAGVTRWGTCRRSSPRPRPPRRSRGLRFPTRRWVPGSSPVSRPPMPRVPMGDAPTR